MNTTPTPNDLDLYINNIVEQLRAKYGYADKNRLMKRVRFYYHSRVLKINGIVSHAETQVIELTYTELTESMNKNELPKEIKELL